MLSLNPTETDTTNLFESKALQPRTESSLNAFAAQHSPCSKRKLCHEDEDPELGGLLVVKHHTSASRNPLALKPRLLIPRSQLPLAYLHTSKSSADPDASPLFSGHIEVLEREELDIHFHEERKTLITANKDDGALFAIEKVHSGVYVLCRLFYWVSLDDFSRKRHKSPRLQYLTPTQDVPGDAWWKEAVIDTAKTREIKDHIGQPSWSISLKPPPSQASTTSASGPDLGLSESVLQLEKSSSSLRPGNNGDEAVVGDVLDTVRAHYMEALYVSRTSLAYFAKGPLSRARATHQLQEHSLSESHGLIEFLRSSILTVTTNDKKYNTTVPQLIREIPIGVMEDDDGCPAMEALYKKGEKSKKRKKISKGGLLPGEEEYIARWWLNRDNSLISTGPGDSREGRIKSAVKEQRARETELQIILILEVLALESAASQNQTSLNEVHIPKIEDKGNTQKPKRSKKHQDLSTLLDILVDRLCIWESTSHEESKPGLEDGSDIANRTLDVLTEDSSKDRLRNFCVEVIIPFYATRLPELYISVCRKLGVALPSPPRPQLKRSATSSRTATKPGTALQQPQTKRPRKTLERVLTDDRMATKRPSATLSRSATDSALPSFKRELSEVSLSAVPPYRPSIQESRRYSQREVDLTAVTQATEAKIQRKAAIEKELKGAIATLKRPNPRMAVQELVDSADQRMANVHSKSRKSSNPQRNPFANSVQVIATPKANRQSEPCSNLPALPNMQSFEPEIIPPSSGPRVPSSSIRPTTASRPHMARQNLSRTPRKPIFPRPGINPVIGATPRRCMSELVQVTSGAHSLIRGPLISDPKEVEPGLSELPEFRSKQNSFKCPGLSMQAQYTPTKTQKHQSFRDHVIDSSVYNTPTKATARLAAVEDLPSDRKGAENLLAVSAEGYARQQAGTRESIYEALGWDDDTDDLL